MMRTTANARNTARLAVRILLAIILGISARGVALADQIVMPAGTLDGDSIVGAAYRFATPVIGRGTLDIEWTDVYGRVVERRSIRFELAGEQEVAFPLDLTRAVAMQNELRLHLFFDGAE